MQRSYPVFTLLCDSSSPCVHVGARVGSKVLKGAGVTLPAILVGEEGRGRQLGLLPVQGAQPEEMLFAASIGTTRAGAPKLLATREPSSCESAIVVARPTPGFRGGVHWRGEISGVAPEGDRYLYGEAPGRVLAKGVVADGLAGNMASGEQRVVLLPAGQVLRVSSYGRQQRSAYVLWTGEDLLTVSGPDRRALPDDHPLAWPAGIPAI